eukprot:3712515-Alexandrium_andersonii.AAC.1
MCIRDSLLLLLLPRHAREPERPRHRLAVPRQRERGRLPGAHAEAVHVPAAAPAPSRREEGRDVGRRGVA